MVETGHRWPARGIVRTAIVSLLAAPLFVLSSTATAVEPPADGLTSPSAAGSCWEIKQNSPSAADGIYWLVTPALQAPEQFYCDMTTDGGGWVLVGRGRENWKQAYAGLGTTQQVRENITGQPAFNARQLSSKTIDGLLNGGRVDALTEGIRLRRARDEGGTTWQEVRFKFTSRDRWVWTFPAEHRVSTYSFDGVSGSGGQTFSFGADSSYRRVDTRRTAAQSYTSGWAYGSSVRGTNSPTTYIWSTNSTAGEARPFTQVFLRPRLRLADLSFPAIPDSGAPKQELPRLAQSGAEPTTWGVTGLANGVDGELHTEVAAFAQLGSRVYVGGNFRYVQRSEFASGTDKVEQSYLAAFDVNTREWVSSFRPQFNGQVKAIAALPNGKLVVGGEFTSVNGVANPALVALNPTTGATDSSWPIRVENRIAGGVPSVRGLSVQGSWVYAAGAFTHFTGGGSSSAVYARSGARFAVSNGAPDAAWNPNFNGTAVGVDASARGDRVYFAGYFTMSNATSTDKAAAIRTAAGAPAEAWTPQWSSGSRSNFQFAIRESGDRVWAGGSEHSVYSWNRATFGRLSGNITKAGGDFQTMTVAANVVYAGCHCNDWNYSNAFVWPDVGSSWTQADKIGHVAAWDSTTGAVMPDFEPDIKGRRGYGAWAVFQDSTGRLWIGGDFNTGVATNGLAQWVGGYVQFAPRDATAPTTPTGFSSGPVGSGLTRLSWGASTDDRGPVRYEVFRGNRVIGVTTATNYDVAVPTESTRYFVRAVDAAGNRSASTSVLTLQPVQPRVDLIATGAQWRYRYSGDAIPAQWRDIAFVDSSWTAGNAVLGFGSAGLGTDISVGAPTLRPLSAHFRHTFQVPNPSVTGVQVSVVADDGVVVYVNGVEVGRANMPAGTISQNTFATAAPRTPTALANRVVLNVPAGVLQAGANTVAAEVHLNYRSTPDVSYDLTLTANA